MKKVIVVLLLVLALVGCGQQPEPEPPQSSYQGGCGVAQNGDYVVASESANFFGLNLQQSREYLDRSVESSCIRKGYDGLLGWSLIEIGEENLTIDYLCCKNVKERL